MRVCSFAVLAILSLLLGGKALAKVNEAEAARLDADLTPIGAIRAGNGAGTIPAWTGGLSTPPASWKRGNIETDPFPDDKPLFFINQVNAELYRDKLTAGHMAMLQQYGPDFVMPVYQTRRTAAFPDSVYEKSRANAVSAELLENGNGVSNTILTSPFPIPRNGLEAVWNHILRYRGEQVSFRSAFATPTRDGSFNPILTEYNYYFAYSEPDTELADIDNKIFYLKTRIVAPSSLAGTINLVHETATLRTGLRHIYGKRVFYVDEDSWQIVATEEYDNDGKLWRVSEAHNISYYTVPVFWTTIETTYDLKAERYFIDGLDDGQGPYDFSLGFRSDEFTASSVRRDAGS